MAEHQKGLQEEAWPKLSQMLCKEKAADINALKDNLLCLLWGLDKEK